MEEKRKQINEIRRALSGFNLSEAEAAVYAASLQLGSRQASKIAKAAGLNRAYTYDILSSLKEKGLVQVGIRRKVRHFSCTPPQHLLGLLEKRELEVAAQRNLLKEALPKLSALLTGADSGREQIRWYLGMPDAQTLLANALHLAKSTVRIAQGNAGFCSEQIEPFIKTLSAKEEVHSIKLLSAEALALDSSTQLEIRSLQMQLEGITVLLFDGSLAILTNSSKPLSLLIEHPALLMAALELFEQSWSQAGPAHCEN